jgi:predicted amidohydrolase
MNRSASYRIAVAQGRAVVDDLDHNLEVLGRLVAQAAGDGADIVVTPELFATGYAPDRAWRHDGASVRAALAELAASAGVTVVASTVDRREREGGEAHFITASVFHPIEGELVRVPKTHLFGEEERRWMTPGAAYADPVAVDGLSCGVGICYDVEFAEFGRAMAVAGADVILVPTAVPSVEERAPGMGEAWHYSATQISTLQVPTRALENGVVIAYANHCGPGFTGRSCIATPYGRNAVLLGDEEAVATVEVPLAAIDAAREVNSYLVDVGRVSGSASARFTS